jgi:GNAT superfamily N-acetyltransferase
MSALSLSLVEFAELGAREAAAAVASPTPRPHDAVRSILAPHPSHLAAAVAYAGAYHSVGMELEGRRAVEEEDKAAKGEDEGPRDGAGVTRTPPLLVPHGPPVPRLPAGLRLVVATADDAECILCLINELSCFEKLGDRMSLSPADLRRDGFGEHPLFHVFLMTAPGESPVSVGAPECGSVAGARAVGLAVVHPIYSTWTGVSIFLEDLFVTPGARAFGLASRLVSAVATAAYALRSRQVSWMVLDWNTPAIKAYERLGASPDGHNWIPMSLDEVGIARLAGARLEERGEVA